MTNLRKDPLLGVTRALLTLLLIVFGCGMGAAVIAMLALPFPFAHDWIGGLGLAEGVSSWDYAWRVLIMLLLAAIFMASGFTFVLLLRRIIDTVSARDPFGPANAQRLEWMACLTVVLVVAAQLQSVIAAWLDELLRQSDRVIVHGISADGLLLALILFILARVFRHGAAMREDLEGTV